MGRQMWTAGGAALLGLTLLGSGISQAQQTTTRRARPRPHKETFARTRRIFAKTVRISGKTARSFRGIVGISGRTGANFAGTLRIGQVQVESCAETRENCGMIVGRSGKIERRS